MNKYLNIRNENIITIGQGSTYTDTVTVEQSAGVPVDLTGYSVRSQLRTVDDVIVGTFACTVPTPANGIIERELAAVTTAALVPSLSVQHVWGIELTAPSGAIVPEIQGGALINPEVVI